MLDIKFLKNNLEQVSQILQTKNFNLDKDKFLNFENSRKVLQEKTQNLQMQRNQKSKEIGLLKSQKKDISNILKEVSLISKTMKENDEKLKSLQNDINNFILEIPNLPDESVPIGKNETFNKIEKTWKDIPKFSFEPQAHYTLGENLKEIDFKSASKITGSRFVILKNNIAKLHRALTQFMLDVHTSNNYQEIYVPFMVNKESLLGTGQLPKFADDLFFLNNSLEYALIPTAEVPITNLLRQVIIDEKELPLKFVSHTPCFRSEAGSYGKDTKGMIRQHQFEKVELIHFVKKEDGLNSLLELTNNAEKILQLLDLPYRKISLCTGDLGFSAIKTYDLEVWLPSQNTYREISSCSLCGDFQARRMQARYKSKTMKKPELLATLNGSALAVGRTLVAILENYQLENGAIKVPEVLIKYMNGTTIIS